MTISEYRDKCKAFIGRIPRDVLIVTVLILASLFSFGLGFLAGEDAAKTVQFSLIESHLDTVSPKVSATEGALVGSKNGTKYYLPHCSGASRISDANKVWFDSADAAQEAGYSPAANCPGL